MHCSPARAAPRTIVVFAFILAKLQSKKNLLGKLEKRRPQVQNLNVCRPAKKVAPQRSPKGFTNFGICATVKATLLARR